MPTARIFLPPGAYTGVGITGGTVPALTAGSIVQTSPTVGDTLTVTGSNAGAGATFLWQIDNGGTWEAAGGTNNAASYDTTGRPAGSYRRQVSWGDKQTPVATAGVTVAAASSFAPSDLFIAGTDGFALLPSTTTSFITGDNTTPAAVGEAVQFQEDSSGLAVPRHFLEPDATRRPLLADASGTFALDFDGAGDRQRRIGFLLADATTGFTLMARVRPDVVTGNQAIIDADEGGGTARNFQFRLNAGRVELIGFNAAGGTVVATSPVASITAGTFYTVCGIFNSTNCRVWIDDMTDAAAAATTVNTAGTVRTADVAGLIQIGSGSGGNFNGLITCPVAIRGSLSEADRVALATFMGAY